MRRIFFLKTLIQVVTCQIAGCPNQSESNIANLYKKTQKKSEWMIANNMVQIWAPTYLQMLFVRPFFGRFWNLGKPLCKHFAGGWPHHFVRAHLDCSYKMVTQVDPPNLQGDENYVLNFLVKVVNMYVIIKDKGHLSAGVSQPAISYGGLSRRGWTISIGEYNKPKLVHLKRDA